MSLLIDRLASVMERELSRILQTEAKEEILKFITVTEVRVTKDLSYAYVYYSFFGKKEDLEKANEALKRTKGYVRSLLAKKVSARKMPDLIYKYDEALEYGNHISELINQINKKDKEN